MRFSLMMRDGTWMLLEADGWMEVARDAELQFGRANIRLILKSDDELPDSLRSVEKIARERYAVEKWVTAYGLELAAKDNSQKALEYLLGNTNFSEVKSKEG